MVTTSRWEQNGVDVLSIFLALVAAVQVDALMEALAFPQVSNGEADEAQFFGVLHRPCSVRRDERRGSGAHHRGGARLRGLTP